jgi:hypothetical protein
MARLERGEAVQRAALGTEVHAAAQRAQGEGVVAGADAQLADARFADVDLDRQAKRFRRRRCRGLRRCCLAGQEPDAVRMQAGDRQLQPPAGRAAARFEGLPARCVETQHAAAPRAG